MTTTSIGTGAECGCCTGGEHVCGICSEDELPSSIEFTVSTFAKGGPCDEDCEEYNGSFSLPYIGQNTAGWYVWGGYEPLCQPTWDYRWGFFCSGVYVALIGDAKFEMNGLSPPGGYSIWFLNYAPDDMICDGDMPLRLWSYICDYGGAWPVVTAVP